MNGSLTPLVMPHPRIYGDLDDSFGLGNTYLHIARGAPPLPLALYADAIYYTEEVDLTGRDPFAFDLCRRYVCREGKGC